MTTRPSVFGGVADPRRYASVISILLMRGELPAVGSMDIRTGDSRAIGFAVATLRSAVIGDEGGVFGGRHEARGSDLYVVPASRFGSAGDFVARHDTGHAREYDQALIVAVGGERLGTAGPQFAFDSEKFAFA
jgi:hypothetical protein